MGKFISFFSARRPWALLLLVFLVTTLACNLPTAARLQERQNAERESAFATLEATLFPDLAGTPAPLTTATFQPTDSQPTPAIPEQPLPAGPYFQYTVQPGDTLASLAGRFSVGSDEIQSPVELPPGTLLPPGTPLIIANTVGEPIYSGALLPDSEIVYSPTAAGFDVTAFVRQAGGYLSSYSEDVNGEMVDGAEIVRRAAVDNSINPRLLLALIEYRSGWVYGRPPDAGREIYPIGFYMPDFRGLRKELSLAIRQLHLGYYGWRTGSLTELTFVDNRTVRIDPRLNAGTVAVQYLFTKLLKEPAWHDALYGSSRFTDLYARMFGDPWEQAAAIGPLLPGDLVQPELQLPFSPGERWSFTAGPHIAWGTGSALAALDFAPVTGEPKCAVSRAWITASAPGVVARSERNVVALDLDGDGLESTGWVVLYLHVANAGRIPAGTVVDRDDPLGHPSCEGGNATGTHVHVARKFNGEWIAADGPLPFEMSGWRALAGERAYQGYLANGDRLVTSHVSGASTSIVVREP